MDVPGRFLLLKHACRHLSKGCLLVLTRTKLCSGVDAAAGVRKCTASAQLVIHSKKGKREKVVGATQTYVKAMEGM